MSIVDVVALGPVIIKNLRNRWRRFQNRDAGYVSPKESYISVYLNIAQSLIPQRVLESDSTATVKLRIQACQMFATKNQKLLYGGRELARNDSLVRDYGVTSGEVLHLLKKNSGILLIYVTTHSGSEYEFQVHRSRNVTYVKQRLSTEDSEELEIYFEGVKLHDEKLVDEICDANEFTIRLLAKLKDRSAEKDEIHLDDDEKTSNDIKWEPVFVSATDDLKVVVGNMVNTTLEGLAIGKPPLMSSEGSGGSYFMQHPHTDSIISVFKPMDEEPNAENNPRSLQLVHGGQGLKKGTRVGEGAIREVAAFILDHPINGPRKVSGEISGFAGVPPTVIVKCLHHGFNHPKGFSNSLECAKVGSLQFFVQNEGSCEDIGPASFPVEEVHRISVLDIRMANADRHAGNILMSKMEGGGIRLIPIDHGYCLPESFEDCTFDWLYWPQSHEPYSAAVVEYVKSLTAEEDIALLRSHGWEVSIGSARTLRISTMLLKKGVALGLTAFQVGQLMCREVADEESAIEQIVNEAQSSLLAGDTESRFLEIVSILMDAKLGGLST